MSNELDRESTINVTLRGLKNTATGAYPVDATVIILELLDDASVAVVGVASIAMPYVSGTGSSSIYRGAIPSTVTLTAGVVYTARVKATSGANVRMFNVAVTATNG